MRTSKQIEKDIYGTDGLYHRVIEKIDSLGGRKSSELTGKSTQHLNSFKKHSEKSRPKLKTIIFIAGRLGVE